MKGSALFGILVVSILIMGGSFYYFHAQDQKILPKYSISLDFKDNSSFNASYPITLSGVPSGSGTYQQLITIKDPSKYGINANGSNIAFYDGSNQTELYAWEQSINSTTIQVWVKNYNGSSTIDMRVLPFNKNLFNSTGYLGEAPYIDTNYNNEKLVMSNFANFSSGVSSGYHLIRDTYTSIGYGGLELLPTGTFSNFTNVGNWDGIGLLGNTSLVSHGSFYVFFTFRTCGGNQYDNTWTGLFNTSRGNVSYALVNGWYVQDNKTNNYPNFWDYKTGSSTYDYSVPSNIIISTVPSQLLYGEIYYNSSTNQMTDFSDGKNIGTFSVSNDSQLYFGSEEWHYSTSILYTTSYAFFNSMPTFTIGSAYHPLSFFSISSNSFVVNTTFTEHNLTGYQYYAFSPVYDGNPVWFLVNGQVGNRLSVLLDGNVSLTIQILGYSYSNVIKEVKVE